MRKPKHRGWMSSKGAFDPDDAKRVKHSKSGVWDLYEEITPELKNIPGGAKLEHLNELRQGLPYVWRMLKDLGNLKNCWFVLSTYLICSVILSLLPAAALWYSGQMIKIVSILPGK